MKQKILTFLKKSFGNIVEWYDFSLYGIFAISISESFFPTENKFVGLLLVFLTFSVSFVARPIGSILFGYIGDKFGKTYSINITVWCMAIPTVLISFLPTYNQIGVLAPMLLVIARLVQGMSVGGQLPGLVVIAVEDGKENKSFFVGTILSIVVVGSLLASLIALISTLTIGPFSKEFEWRVPFFLSGVLFYIYLKTKPEHEKTDTGNKFELMKIFKSQPNEFIYMSCLSGVMNCIYYIMFSYLITYLNVYVQTSNKIALLITNALLILSLPLYFIAGKSADKSSDRISAGKKFTLIFCVGAILLSLGDSVYWVTLCFTIMSLAYCLFATYLTSMFAEIFEEKYRMTACCLSYSCGTIFAGFSPVLSEILAKKSFGGFFMYMLCLGFALYLIQDKIKETNGYKKFISG